MNSPLVAYRRAVAQGDFQPDAAQEAVAQLLEQCQQTLLSGSTRRGIYLWGPVGRGKTWLMDRFRQGLQVPARRQHFHRFMREVHQRLFGLSGVADPLRALAGELSAEVRVLCFDELFVSDIGDAIILGRLLREMFDAGVMVVATSNQPPASLYAEGFNRDRFLPAIAAIERHMQVVALDGGQDHRLHPGASVQRYLISPAAGDSLLAEPFDRLTVGHPARSGPVPLGFRTLDTVRHADRVIWCRFADLCERPFSSVDFIVLCDRFDTLLLSEVPRLGAPQQQGRIARGTEDGAIQVRAGDRVLPSLAQNDDAVRRFIALVDECYDRRVPIHIEAAVPMEALYTEGYLTFAFRRTLSRLREMQLQRFGR